MATQGSYGLNSVKLFKATKYGAMPDFNDANAIDITDIVKDSASFSDTASSVTNIEIEDSDQFFATIETDKGTHGFTFQTYNMSDEMMCALLGFENDALLNGIKRRARFDLPNYAIQIETKAFGNYPAMLYQFASCKVVATRTGTIGKSGFGSIQLDCTENVARDADGNEAVSAQRFNLTQGAEFYTGKYFKTSETDRADEKNYVYLKNDGKYYSYNGSAFALLSAGTIAIEGGSLVCTGSGVGSVTWAD